jgi:hypothetical protein
MTTPTSYMSKLLCLQEQTGPPIFSLDPKGPEVKMANWFFYYFLFFQKYMLMIKIFKNVL